MNCCSVTPFFTGYYLFRIQYVMILSWMVNSEHPAPLSGVYGLLELTLFSCQRSPQFRQEFHDWRGGGGLKYHQETKGRFRKRVVFTNVPSFCFRSGGTCEHTRGLQQYEAEKFPSTARLQIWTLRIWGFHQDSVLRFRSVFEMQILLWQRFRSDSGFGRGTPKSYQSKYPQDGLSTN